MVNARSWTARVSAGLLLGALASVAVEDPSEVATVDDECQVAGDDGQCAFSALQHRGRFANALEQRQEAASADRAYASCYDVKEAEGGECMKAINWAKEVGYPQHPEWYPDLDPATATLADWQYFAWNSPSPECPLPCSGKGKAFADMEKDRPKAASGADCHDMQPGEPGACMNSINWAKNVGYPQHPDWYPGIDPATSTLADWQFFAWNTTHPTCPKPCTSKLKAEWDASWCDSLEAPVLWVPDSPSKPVQIKALSYNLYWWNLFKIHGGLSAAVLIRDTGKDAPYDVIGLQECEDPAKVFGPAGLADQYEAFNTSKATCMAYRTAVWTLLDKGEDEVAMDMRTEYFGHRSAQWMRLQHKATGMKLLFVNHHGPLSVNSGGACGGKATAHNLAKVMAKRGQKGDTVILVGDFNANAASQTVQSLWPILTHVYNSKSFGGVDNIFSNAPKKAIVETSELGTGGSDHNAISVVIELPLGLSDEETTVERSLAAASEAAHAEPAHTVGALEHAQGSDACLLEPKTMFVYPAHGWTLRRFNVIDPRICCSVCEVQEECTSWTWEEWNDDAKGPVCDLHQGAPTRKDTNLRAVSGLPKSAATKSAKSAYRAAALH